MITFRESPGPAVTRSAIVWIYVLAIVATELSIVVTGAFVGGLSTGLLLIGMLLHAAIRHSDPSERLLPVLALVPLGTLLTLVVPSRQGSAWIWLIVLAVALTLGSLRMGWVLGLRYKPRIQERRWVAVQAGIAAVGIPLGILGAIVGPSLGPQLFRDDLGALGFAAIGFGIGAGEEIMFRGVLQPLLSAIVPGRTAIGLTTIMFTSAYLGSLSAGYVIVAMILSLGYGWAALRTRTATGAVIGHGAFLLTLVTLS